MSTNRIWVFLLFLVLLQLPVFFYQVQLIDDENNNDDNNASLVFGGVPENRAQIGYGAVIERNEHGGSWLDSFKGADSIENKSENVELFDGSAVFSPLAKSFTISTTEDFDTGIKKGTETKTDSKSLPAGEIRMVKGVILSESFDGPDELDLLSYNSSWKINKSSPAAGTIKLDSNEFYAGNASLRLKTNAPKESYYLGAGVVQNHTGYETVMKFKITNGVTQYSYLQSYNSSKSTLVKYFGSAKKYIRYYDGKTMYNTNNYIKEDTWYKWTLKFDYDQKTYNGWVDGDTYNNYHVAKNLAFFDTIPFPWSQIIWLNSGSVWDGVSVTTWVDNLTVWGYPEKATWESAKIELPQNMSINQLNIEHYNLTKISWIDKIQVLVDNAVMAEYDTDIINGERTIIYETDLTTGSFSNVDNDFTIKLIFASNQARSPVVTEISGVFESQKGFIISEPVTPDSKCHWDTISIDKYEPAGSTVTISILDSNLTPISGFEDITIDGELDISALDVEKYSNIHLKAVFSGAENKRPKLSYWGISWVARDAWRDTFFEGLKIAKEVNITHGDGESWLTTDITDWMKYPENPVLKANTSISWEPQGVARPAVIYNGSGYMMWYTGLASFSWSIGFATSDDGITWSKYESKPVITPGPPGSWDNRYTAAPCVIYDGTIYKMWYQGQNLSTDWNIGYATSYDGINWNKHPNNPVLKTDGDPFAWDGHYCAAPFVYFDGLEYKMWFSGLSYNTTNRPYQIGYATSPDGINWTKNPSNPILKYPSGWYTGLGNPSIIIENNKFHGWYGNKSTNFSRIDYSTSYDGLSWTKHSSNPVLSRGPSSSWDGNSIYGPEVYFNGRQYWMYYSGSGTTTTLNQIGLAVSKFDTPGIIRSEKITRPSSSHFDRLLVNATTRQGTGLSVSILDGNTNVPISGYQDLTDSEIDLTALDSAQHPTIILRAKLTSTGFHTPLFFDWSVGWKSNISGGESCVDIDPDTLNLKSKGNWITCYIEPKDGSDPAKINISTVLLNGTVPAEPHPTEVGDYDNDSMPDRMVKFNRSDVQELVSVGDNVTLWVEGYYDDGSYFKCSDTIRVINPPEEPHNNGKAEKNGKGKKG